MITNNIILHGYNKLLLECLENIYSSIHYSQLYINHNQLLNHI